MIGALLAKQRIPEGMKALNQKNLDAFLKDWADEAVLVYPGDIPGFREITRVEARQSFCAQSISCGRRTPSNCIIGLNPYHVIKIVLKLLTKTYIHDSMYVKEP